MFADHKLTIKHLLWQSLIFVAVAFTALEAPYSFIFNTKMQSWQLYSDGIISLLFLADVCYQINKYLQNKAKKTYGFAFYFLLSVDIAACVPFDIIAYNFGLEGGVALFNLVRLFRLVRIVRIITFLKGMTIVPQAIKIPMLVVCSLIVVHWVACGWVLIHEMNEPDNTTHYIKSLYWAITTLTTIGYGDITPVTNQGRLYTMFIMILGVGVYGIVIGNIANMISASNKHREKSKEKLSDLALFMKHYKVPARLQQAVFNYFNHLMAKRLSDNDTSIISDLPQALQLELQTYMNIKMIANVTAFKGLSRACLKDIAQALEQKYYAPGQNIIQIGELGDEMYIIGHGQADIILKDGNTVATLHEGQFFGEAALLKQTTRNANVRANTYCDLYRLSKDKFYEIVSNHPGLLENIEKITKKRFSDRSTDKQAS